MKSFSPQLPIPFDTDWHHQLGRSLAVFPRNISFRDGHGLASYWPDLATFTGDERLSLLMYYPASPSSFSVCVIYRKTDARWETVKFRDDTAVQHSTGSTFDDVMEQTIATGLCRGEG